jgi:hypothetical protein
MYADDVVTFFRPTGLDLHTFAAIVEDFSVVSGLRTKYIGAHSTGKLALQGVPRPLLNIRASSTAYLKMGKRQNNNFFRQDT